uniref:hypothetical protein n=1 Tax=Cupriavidus gilardii TaxID=82541 RepID=UPI002479C922|nr:hypothetical protein [Cupriavidus gilardii]
MIVMQLKKRVDAGHVVLALFSALLVLAYAYQWQQTNDAIERSVRYGKVALWSMSEADRIPDRAGKLAQDMLPYLTPEGREALQGRLPLPAIPGYQSKSVMPPPVDPAAVLEVRALLDAWRKQSEGAGHMGVDEHGDAALCLDGKAHTLDRRAVCRGWRQGT